MVDLLEKTTGAENVLWDLSVFYSGANDPKIASDMTKISELADAFAQKYKGRLGEMDVEDYVDANQEMEVISDLLYGLGSYAQLDYSTDQTNTDKGALVAKVTEFSSQIGQKLIFFDLEWNELDDAVAQKILDDPTLGKYQYPMETDRRYRPYQLTEPEEQIVIEKNVTGNSAWTRFFDQLMAKVRFDYDGEKLQLEQVLTRIKDPNREVRMKAADSLTAGLREHKMELTYIFNTLAQDKAISDKRRGYPSWISSRNLSNKAPDEVVDALIDTVTSNYDLVARHYNIKKALLGYDELYDYDRYAPLALKESEQFYTWEEAKKIVLDAYYAFSPEMGAAAEKFFTENWIHAPVVEGKRGGAYASPTVPSAHPFVFVNFQGKTDDVMTLAHELGHGVHMYLSAKKVGMPGMYTPLTTAEMASVFGEMLVFHDLISKETDKEIQLSMLSEKLEGAFATVYRQTSMNRFEDGLHTARREEGELSSERISEIWHETQQAMFGDSVIMRDDYSIWWSYVPHFLHVPGYVYAYAFGELLVLALYRIYEEEGASFVPKYVELLAQGDSDYPDKLLAECGVDLNDPQFWHKGIEVLGEMIDWEESLAKELFPEKFA